MNPNRKRRPNRKKNCGFTSGRIGNRDYWYLESRFCHAPTPHHLCFTCRMINPSCDHDGKILAGWRIRIPRKTADFRWQQLEKRLRHKMNTKPLNGTKTHPLSIHAKQVLAEIARAPVPKLDVNPGVRDRLYRESLIEFVKLPSPYKKHKGGKCDFLQITKAGLDALA
jgi:hypothetical protein